MTADLRSTPPAVVPSTEDGGATLLCWLREMRESHPVWRDAFGSWHVFRYGDVRRVMGDPEVFSSDLGRVIPVFQKFREGNLVFTDPPRHHQLRRLAGAAFSPKVVTGLAPSIAEITGQLLDTTGGCGEFDLVSTLAYPLPVTVIAELLGLPTADRELFRTWADRLFDRKVANLNDSEFTQSVDGVRADMLAYLHGHCQDRRARPRQDLMSTLATVEADGQRLTDTEVINFSFSLLFAGHFTTTALLGNILLCLDEHPEALAELRTDRSLIPATIEEVLRYRPSFTQVGRMSMAESTLADQLIPANVHLMLWLLSANRDEREFTDPGRFDIHRGASHHVAFGHGIHVCLGQLLARLQAKVALGVLLDRCAEIRLNPAVPLKFYGRGIFAARNVPVVTRPA